MKELKLKPYKYQEKGIEYNLEHTCTIIGDKPGLGKTMQAIASVQKLNAFPCLVICPATLKINWQREWELWTNKKSLILNNVNRDTWHLMADPETNIFGDGAMAEVFITNYESLSKFFVSRIIKNGNQLRLKDILFHDNIKLFKSVIVDESHRVKDPTTQQAKFVKGITTGKKVKYLLTGTPVVNKPIDLVSQLGILEQIDKFGGYKVFKDRFCGGGKGATNLGELNRLLRANCFYQRTKEEVLKELPEKVRQVVYSDISTRKEYQDAVIDLEQYLREYRKASDEEIKRALRGKIMVQIGILKNISARGKIKDVIEYVKDIIITGEKIVIFVHLKEVAKALLTFFPNALTIVGDNTMDERQQNIDRFQSDPKAQIMIASIKAAGVGITLTASSRVLFVELPWHPADTEQCEDRCHRIGQKDSVQATYILGKGTIDEQIYNLIEKKRDIADRVTGNKDNTKVSVLEDVAELLIKQKNL
jgi:SWI/SNF-related matrix-associated actin-dependent regulator 1 of chromatin subfamily A